jgi:hypothetical protein
LAMRSTFGLGCPEASASARIATEIIPSGVVGHKHDDIGSFVRRLCRVDCR